MKSKLTKQFEAEADKPKAAFVLRLYVAGTSERSTRAIMNAKDICDTHLPGRYELEIVDIIKQPARAKEDHIVAVPTLVKRLPEPLRRFIGDLTNREGILVGLEVKPK